MSASIDLEFLQTSLQLKEIPRAGWKKRGIDNGESVADHTFGVLLLTLKRTENYSVQDRLKALEMAIAHDLPEAIMGDYTPADRVSISRKRKEEDLAMDFLDVLCTGSTSATLRERLAEYNEHHTEISQLIHEADKLDALLTAVRYRRIYPEAERLEDFEGHIEHLKDETFLQIGAAALEKWNIQAPKVEYIFLIGGPGVGKGTQCEYIAHEFNAACFSLGELLRRQADDKNSPYREFINKSFRESVPVPGQLAMEILLAEINTAVGQGKSLIVLDGFPRSLKQLTTFSREISTAFSTIYMRCPADVLDRRLQVRAQSSNRMDDLDAAIRTVRANQFEIDNANLIAELRKHTFQEIDGARSKSDVSNEIGNYIKTLQSRVP